LKRRYFFVFFLLCSLHGATLASCGGGLVGTAERGSLYIGYGDCDYDEEMVVYKRHSEERAEVFRFQSQCRWSTFAKVGVFQPFRGFVCQKTRGFPLAGVKYVLAIERSLNDACGKRPKLSYKCTMNCTSFVPKTIDFLPVECD
jgi:hypothetical protein